MAVKSPEKITAAFLAAYNARNKAALMALYAEDAAYTFNGVTIITGLGKIGAAFDRGLASSLNMTGSVLSCVTSCDTALVRMHWKMVKPDGGFHSEGVSCEILRKGADGLWRYIIDDATGGNRAAPSAP